MEMTSSTPQHTLVLVVEPDGTPTEHIERAAALLRDGKLVAFPTETVYGLGADATNAAAVAAIFAAKERPYSDPLIVHLASAEHLPRVATAIPPVAWALAERFWPGPLTLVLPRAASIPPVVTGGGPTVGVRVPSHPVAQALIAAAGVPVAAPSANRFMHTSPTSAAHVLADLDGRIDCVLDGGSCPVGVESTVLDVTTDPPRILRPGGVTLEALRAVLPDLAPPAPVHAPSRFARPTSGLPEAEGATGKSARERASPATQERKAAGGDSEPARAPGQMARHYAPHTRLLVFDAQGGAALAAITAEARAALARGLRVGVLLPDEEASALSGLPVQIASLGPASDLAEVTRRLYAALRALDDGALDLILAHTFGQEGLGLALWDRLWRAAGGEMREIDRSAGNTEGKAPFPA
jgi:L-threonylcarbamoyladenylate synthase